MNKITDRQASWLIFIFIGFLIVGLFLFPQLSGQGPLSIEVLVLAAFTTGALLLLALGVQWADLQQSVRDKVKEAVPAMLILMSIGVLIGSWLVSGTIPMLIYYGLQVVAPGYLYVFAFGICILFSLLTGTSWGSAGTIGIVVMGMAQVYEANLAITAAAIVGGAYFGDKLSPLSDTTNIAALATGVDLFAHIRSMLYTTIPSAVIAAVLYTILSLQQIPVDTSAELLRLEQTRTGLAEMFRFSGWLLLPLLVVVVGASTRRPIVLTLLLSSFTALLVAAVFQEVSFSDMVASLSVGFSTGMLSTEPLDETIPAILNRGGLYSMKEAVLICFLIFTYLGLLQHVSAIERTMRPLLKRIRSRATAVAAALLTTSFTNLFSSNQYATSFIVGASFSPIFDRLGLARRVLSRSLEDAGTMIENLAPWTPTGIFMASTLGVATLDYAPWQFLSLINLAIAYFYAFTGIARFTNEQKTNAHE